MSGTSHLEYMWKVRTLPRKAWNGFMASSLKQVSERTVVLRNEEFHALSGAIFAHIVGASGST